MASLLDGSAHGSQGRGKQARGGRIVEAHHWDIFGDAQACLLKGMDSPISRIVVCSKNGLEGDAPSNPGCYRLEGDLLIEAS